MPCNFQGCTAKTHLHTKLTKILQHDADVENDDDDDDDDLCRQGAPSTKQNECNVQMGSAGQSIEGTCWAAIEASM